MLVIMSSSGLNVPESKELVLEKIINVQTTQMANGVGEMCRIVREFYNVKQIKKK